MAHLGDGEKIPRCEDLPDSAGARIRLSDCPVRHFQTRFLDDSRKRSGEVHRNRECSERIKNVHSVRRLRSRNTVTCITNARLVSRRDGDVGISCRRGGLHGECGLIWPCPAGGQRSFGVTIDDDIEPAPRRSNTKISCSRSSRIKKISTPRSNAQQCSSQQRQWICALFGELSPGEP